ncbi:asparagine synthetase B family protein [Spirosoma areae]
MSELLQHRGTVISRPIGKGTLLMFGGNVEDNPLASSLVTVADADVYETQSGSRASAGYSFSVNFAHAGPASFNNLSADFAVALWDLDQQTLSCGRDPLGIKPLYYVHQPGRFFAFASEIKALLVLREVVVKPNEAKFREYLTWTTDYVPYSAETFYAHVYSVLPGHCLRVNAEKMVSEPYWKLDPQKFNGLRGADAYADLFHEYFTKAVDSRMRGKNSIGSHLSGGLDSSSVSCVAQHLLIQQQRPSLHTFNIDTEQPAADEQQYVQAVVDQWQMHHHRVRPIADVLESVLKINYLFDRPEQFIIPSSFHLSVSEEARRAGCDLLLTGHDGDSIVTTGHDFLDELVDAGDWAQLQQACQQLISARNGDLVYGSADWLRSGLQDKYEAFVLSKIGTNLKGRITAKTLPSFLLNLRRQKQLFGLSTAAILTYSYKRLTEKLARQALIDNALSADFKQRVPGKRKDTTEQLATTLSVGQQMPVNQVLNTTNVICNEQMNHIGAYYGHSYSFPFFDKNVVELGLATPLAIQFDAGRGRGPIRNGLRDTLPPAIVSRFSKANFVEYGTLAAQQLYTATREQFALASHPIWNVVDRRVFAKIVSIVFDQRVPVRTKTRYNWLVSRIIYLALWLDKLPM